MKKIDNGAKIVTALPIDYTHHFRCICQKGFSGDLCDANIDECSSNPCTNGGTCVDKIDSFKCHCPPGYADTLCQTGTNILGLHFVSYTTSFRLWMFLCL